MTASERLRALVEEACSQEWPFLITNEESPIEAVHAIRAALPLIADVVEAAEEWDAAHRIRPARLMKLDRALTALRDALEEK